jgi:hypothetical protein
MASSSFLLFLVFLAYVHVPKLLEMALSRVWIKAKVGVREMKPVN